MRSLGCTASSFLFSTSQRMLSNDESASIGYAFKSPKRIPISEVLWKDIRRT